MLAYCIKILRFDRWLNVTNNDLGKLGVAKKSFKNVQSKTDTQYLVPPPSFASIFVGIFGKLAIWSRMNPISIFLASFATCVCKDFILRRLFQSLDGSPSVLFQAVVDQLARHAVVAFRWITTLNVEWASSGWVRLDGLLSELLHYFVVINCRIQS